MEIQTPVILKSVNINLNDYSDIIFMHVNFYR